MHSQLCTCNYMKDCMDGCERSPPYSANSCQPADCTSQIGSTAQYRAASLCADTISAALDFGLSFPAGTMPAEGSSVFLFIQVERLSSKEESHAR